MSQDKNEANLPIGSIVRYRYKTDWDAVIGSPGLRRDGHPDRFTDDRTDVRTVLGNHHDFLRWVDRHWLRLVSVFSGPVKIHTIVWKQDKMYLRKIHEFATAEECISKF